MFPELDDLEPLLSDQEEIQSETLARSLIPSPSGTSAPLLSNPSLTDTLSNFSLLNPNKPKRLAQIQQTPNTRAKTLNRPQLPYNQTSLADEDDHEVDLLAAETNAPFPQAEAPHLLRNQQYDAEKAHERDFLLEAHPEPMTEPRHCPKFSKTLRLINLTHVEIFRRKHQLPASNRYQLRANRAQRYKCGTCGSRNCTCVHETTIQPPDLRLARGVAISACELALAQTPEHPQYEILAVRAQRQESITQPTVRHIIVTVEKIYARIESGLVPPLESTLKAMHDFSPSDCPTYRSKEWKHHERGGLEFTITAVIPPLPPSNTFGQVNKT